MDRQELQANINNMYNKCQNEINTIIEKAKTEKLSIEDYFSLYSNYKKLQQNNEHKDKLCKYSHMIKTMMEDDSISHSAEEYCCLSHIFFDEKLYDKSISSINKAISIEPNTIDYYVVKGEFYLDMGKKEEAQIAFSKAIAIQPELKHVIKDIMNLNISNQNTKNIVNLVTVITILACAFMIWIWIRILLS